MKLALVIPWFGRNLKGGAEQLAWELAWRLAVRGHAVDVLTTCCRSHQDDWSTNHLAAGVSHEPEGFRVHRFPVVEREQASFDSVCGALQRLTLASLRPGVPAVTAEESSVFVEELIKSPTLIEYVDRHKEAYDRFILLPYLYGPVLKAVQILGERGALQPCLHDESYAYLPQVEEAFRAAGRLLFNSEGEQELAFRLFGPGLWDKSAAVGAGVEFPAELWSGTDTAAGNDVAFDGFSSKHYVLYLGRKDAGKNVPMLVRAFQRFRAVRPNSKLQLLLAGNGSVDFNGNAEGLQDLGLVSEDTKQRLLRHCTALFQPSHNESFSRVMMEAWMYAKPVAAHRSCLATAVAVERAGGGWLAGPEEEWAGLFEKVDGATKQELAPLGQQGQRYAQEFADWDRVITRYEAALLPKEGPLLLESPLASHRRSQINQFLPNLAHGDAISNYAIWIRDHLRELGFGSEIYARYIDPNVGHECSVFSVAMLETSDAAIYHHSIGSEVTPHLVNYSGPKALIYHNITPAEFFASYSPAFATIVQRGRDDLPLLAADFKVCYGDSRYNAEELRACSFQSPGVIPIPLNPAKWNFAPDPEVMDKMQDGRTNLLFVGRIAPNKKQTDLVRALEKYLALDSRARLVLVGKAGDNDPYAAQLREIIATSGLVDHVIMPGSVTEAQLAGYYRTAHLFWSMSEHEGFCVPLVEAMWFDVPVFAYSSSAVPETLGEGGLLFTNKTDLRSVAAAAYLVREDQRLRSALLKHQRAHRESYLPCNIGPLIDKLAAQLLPP